MAFYPFSILSYIPLGIAYAVMLLFYGFLWWFSSAMKARAAVRAVGGFVLLLFPVSEELWIAWNFARACESAGTFVSKKVVVDGFYDGPGASLELVRSGGYRFVEGPRRDGGVDRVTLGDKAFTDEALRRFDEQNKNSNGGDQDSIRVKLDSNTEALIYPKKGDSWRIERLDRPTARYHFRYADSGYGTRWSHKILRIASVVVDTETKEEIARYVSFGRDAPWFFVGLDRPGFACDGPGRWPFTRGTRLIYREALIPSTLK